MHLFFGGLMTLHNTELALVSQLEKKFLMHLKLRPDFTATFFLAKMQRLQKAVTVLIRTSSLKNGVFRHLGAKVHANFRSLHLMRILNKCLSVGQNFHFLIY